MTIKITESAARQILGAAKQGEMEGLALRIAAKRRPDGSIDYVMGFDEPAESDSRVDAFGVTVVVAPTSTELMDGMTLDFVELEPGRSDFIFLNPNDPHYVPPTPAAD